MEGFAEANSLIKELAALRAFHDFFWDRYENLFAHFGAEAIDLITPQTRPKEMLHSVQSRWSAIDERFPARQQRRILPPRTSIGGPLRVGGGYREFAAA